MYNKVSTDLNFTDREKKIEQFWKDEKIFEKSIIGYSGFIAFSGMFICFSLNKTDIIPDR